MNNSLDAIHGAGTLSVEICRQPPIESYQQSYFKVDVRDSGIGISADRLDQIFEPFFTTKELGKGTGLGLAVSKEIVGQHKGRISVVSQVGKGTCFTVLLPEIVAAEPRQVQMRSAKEVESL
jgi:signal transduction histidine kinase